MAIVHHLFVWIHPFNNGNGRTARLLTYAMLLKIFNIHQSRLLHPSAIFCAKRNSYYETLQKADYGDSLSWCEFVLQNLFDELQKNEKLTDFSYVQKNILEPSIKYARKTGAISKETESALLIAASKPILQAADFSKLWPDTFNRSRNIQKLLKANFLKTAYKNARKYTLNFSNGPLTTSYFIQLNKEGFLPSELLEN